MKAVPLLNETVFQLKELSEVVVKAPKYEEKKKTPGKDLSHLKVPELERVMKSQKNNPKKAQCTI